MGRNARSPPGILVPYASSVPAWRDRWIPLLAGRSLGENPLRARSEISQEDVAVSEPKREIGERSEVVRDRQIAQRKRASRHPAQRTVRDATRRIHCH